MSHTVLDCAFAAMGTALALMGTECLTRPSQAPRQVTSHLLLNPCVDETICPCHLMEKPRLVQAVVTAVWIQSFVILSLTTL